MRVGELREGGVRWCGGGGYLVRCGDWWVGGWCSDEMSVVRGWCLVRFSKVQV